MQRPLTSSRREILNLLKVNGGMTADQVSRAIGTTAVAVRQHLQTLEAEGLVTSYTERRPVGRPVQVYVLTSKADDLFPKNYPLFIKVLLEELKELVEPSVVEQLFKRIKERLKADYSPHLKGKTPEEKVVELARLRDVAGYMTEVQREDGVFFLVEHNCAISKVAQDHPQTCQVELDLFQELIPEAEVTRVCHIASGDPVCRYAIRLKEG